MLLSQLTPTAASVAAAVATACIAGAVAITKKLLPNGKDHITRSEFHSGLDSLRDRLDSLGSSIHSRLTQLDAAVARLDERTKK